MQQVNSWPHEFSVSEPVARVLVDGKEMEVDSLTVSSSLDSAAPDMVAAGGGGVVAATADMTVLPADDVNDAGLNPWGEAQRIATASEVVVEAGYKTEAGTPATARLLTGQVDALDGSATEPGIGLKLVDYTGVLDRDITIEPLLSDYPPLRDFGLRRNAGLLPTYVTDRILRHCGYYATPPQLDGSILSATMMGSVMPERGTMYATYESSSSTPDTLFRSTPWGVGVDAANILYFPDLSGRSHGRLTSSIMVTFNRRVSTHSNPGTSRVDLRWGENSANAVSISINPNGSITALFRDSGSYNTVAWLSDSRARDAESFSVHIRPSGQITISASNGESVSGTGSVPTRLSATDMEQIYVQVPPNSQTIGGLQVAYTTTSNHNFVRNAHIDPPIHNHSLTAFPSQINQNCLGLLKEQAEAELAAIWIDEHGHFMWKNRATLQQSPPVGTLTSLDNLLDLPWEFPVKSVFSRVEIEHSIPTVTRRWIASITVAGGRGDTLSNGDTENRFFEPPADQDWHLVDSPQWLGGTFNPWWLRAGRGSYRGGIIVRSDDPDYERIAYSSRLTQSWEQINPQRWLLSSTAHSLPDNESIEQRYLDIREHGSLGGESTPSIRARGLVEWGSDKTTGRTLGEVLAPVFVHSVGAWVQDNHELQDLADWLADALTEPGVALRDVPIVPDPRIQKGDIFWLEDATAYDVRLRVLVVGIQTSFQSSGDSFEMSQSISCRIISSDKTTPEVTLEAHDHAWEGSRLQDQDIYWDGRTLEDHDTNPAQSDAPEIPPNPLPTNPAPTLYEHDQSWEDETLQDQDTHWQNNTLEEHDDDPLKS